MLTLNRLLCPKTAEKLFKAIREESEKGNISQSRSQRLLTDFSLFSITYNTGLRVSEVSALNWVDIHTDFLKVVSGKGSKPRTVFFGRKTLSLFTNLREEKKTWRRPFEASGAVFVGERGRLSQSAIHRRFKYWVSRLDLLSSLSFHSLRHGYATRMLDNGVSLPFIRDQLGHSNISVTSEYLHFTAKSKERVLSVT